MNDVQTPADTTAGDEVVRADDARETATTPEKGGKAEQTPPESRADAEDAAAPDSDGDGKADEAETRTQERRRLRREQMAAIRKDAADAAAAARKATEALERIRQAGQAKKPPKQSDFENYDDYIAAYTLHAARVASNEDQAETLTESKAAAESAEKAARQRAAEQAQAAFSAEAAEARKRYADFDAVVFNKGPDAPNISPAVVELILFSDYPADVAYAVASDRALAARLSAMPPIEAARELGRVEARMTAPKPRIETKAPDPISPVKGKGGALRDPLKMTASEFAKWREEGGTF